MKLEYLVIHCTATPEGRNVSKEEIEMWHKAPRQLKDGSWKYMGKVYEERDDLPEEKLNGRDIRYITGRGWDRFGYSDMLHIDGKLENLTPYNQDNKVDPWEMTWGASGINSKSRHVVYVGGLREEVIDDHFEPADTRTEDQIDGLEIYAKYMILRHPDIKIAGHNSFSKKACPCFNVAEWCESVGIPEKNIYRK
jgi:N-acetylmuramoyl-L-alanine amidase